MSYVPLYSNTHVDHAVIRWNRRRSVVLTLLIALSILMRIGYMEINAHPDLSDFFAPRSISLAQNGLFSMYAQPDNFNYPPFSLILTGMLTSLWISLGGSLATATGAGFVAILKLVSVSAEVGIVAFSYLVLPPRTRICWFVPMLLAIYPGLIATTAFWGQTDALFTLPLLIAFWLLQQDHPRWAWAVFALALLTKFQAVVAVPLLLVLTFRRYGWRTTLICLLLLGGIAALTLAPFVAVSGLSSVFVPFTAAVDQFSAYTINALNVWYLANPNVWTMRPPLLFEYPPDTQILFAGLTAKLIGLSALAAYVGGLLILVWRRAEQRDEWLWLTASYFGFFLLPTQMHERYLYPAAVASLLAVAQDRRLWWVALPTFLAFSYNVIITTQAPFDWLGMNPLFLLGDVTVFMALLLIATFGALNVILLTEANKRRLVEWVFPLLIVGLTLTVGLKVAIPTPLPAGVTPLRTTLADSFQLAGFRLTSDADVWKLDLYWRAYAFNNQDYQMFVHVLQNGEIVAQEDARPQGGNYPTWRWFHNDLIVTSHQLAITADVSPDTINVGLYDPTTFVRVAVWQDDQAAPDNAVRVWINQTTAP